MSEALIIALITNGTVVFGILVQLGIAIRAQRSHQKHELTSDSTNANTEKIVKAMNGAIEKE